MLEVSCRFVPEINEMGRDEDEGENQRDHHVVVHAAALISPENIALCRLCDAHRIPKRYSSLELRRVNSNRLLLCQQSFRGVMQSTPMYLRSASGIRTLPSAC